MVLIIVDTCKIYSKKLREQYKYFNYREEEKVCNAKEPFNKCFLYLNATSKRKIFQWLLHTLGQLQPTICVEMQWLTREV